MFSRVQTGLWLGHSRTFTELSRSHSFVILAVCLGSLCCWNLRPSPRSERSGAVFHQGCLWLILTAWCCHHHASLQMYMVSSRHDACHSGQEFNFCFIGPEYFVSNCLKVLQVPFGKLQAGCKVPFAEEWLEVCYPTRTRGSRNTVGFRVGFRVNVWLTASGSGRVRVCS